MKKLQTLFVLWVILSFLLINPTQSSADEIYCPPSILGHTVSENVIVARSICSMQESEIKGNIEIRNQGTLEITGSTVHGNVKVRAYGTFATAHSRHNGNIECEEGAEVFIGCAVELKGNVDEKCAPIDSCE
jgi:hypothetical protein